MRPRTVLAFVLPGLLASVSPARAQYPSNEYEMRYGEPVPVSLDSLVSMPESYVDKAVSVTGVVEMVDRDMWALAEAGVRVLILPMNIVRNRFEDDVRTAYGAEMEVRGVVSLGQNPITRERLPLITFWAFLAPEERKDDSPVSPEVTLEELLTRQGEQDGRTVRVVGQFRGANLFGDLPGYSRWKSRDWVLKDDVFAVWITGKRPRGSGWRLDPKLRRDTGKWLLVEGRVRTVEGVVYILAGDVSMTTAPAQAAKAKDVPRPPPPPLKPPVVVFSLPLDGERDVPQDTVFRVQFSNDMDEESFIGRVGLRYAGRPRPGDRVLDAITISYDMGRRALTVDPGDLLRAGRMVELILLSGIRDIDDQPLEPRPDHDPGGAAEVLRFQVAGTLLTGP